MHKWDRELNSAINAAEKAGQLLNNNFEKKISIIRKSAKEFVTEIDLESQSIIIESLQNDFPDYHFYTEESRNNTPINGLTWVIDPIDGTHNYISGLTNVGISIALVSEEDIHLGVIFFPMKSMILYSINGQGSFCNGDPIKVSNNKDLSKSMVAYDNDFHLSSDAFIKFEKIIASIFTIRIFGAATWDIALIAMGKIDARIWNNTKLVDVAAGYVILKEAGGQMTDFNSKSFSLSPSNIIASNGYLHNDLVDILKG